MIIMASDHRGFALKEELKIFLNQENIISIDVGTYSKEPVDYPNFAKLGIDKVLEKENNVGIFICGSGIGMSIAANKNPKIRAALCLNTKMAMLARKDNDANVLCLSGTLKKKKAIRIVKTFLTTDFEGGRHARRLKQISEIIVPAKADGKTKATSPKAVTAEEKASQNKIDEAKIDAKFDGKIAANSEAMTSDVKTSNNINSSDESANKKAENFGNKTETKTETKTEKKSASKTKNKTEKKSKTKSETNNENISETQNKSGRKKSQKQNKESE